MPSENLPPALGTNCRGKEGDQADMVTMPGPGGGSEYPVSGSVLQVWGLYDLPIGQVCLGKKGLKDDAQVTRLTGRMKCHLSEMRVQWT